jgi:hypothetical protein
MIVEIRRIKMKCKRCGGMMVYENFMTTMREIVFGVGDV